jgi:hypothetical protein
MTEILIEDIKDFWVFYTMLPVTQLTPVQTLEQSIKQTNMCIDCHGRDTAVWPEYAQNEIARLVWVNWIVNNLKFEPIRKPVLVHRDRDQLLVDCGDTRIMAATLHNTNASLPVITTCRPSVASVYQTWTRILSNQQLFEILNFDPKHAKILVRHAPTDSDYAFDWMEISDQSTAHHWHDETQRRNTIQRYLNQQSNSFYFSKEWVLESIDWHALR